MFLSFVPAVEPQNYFVLILGSRRTRDRVLKEDFKLKALYTHGWFICEITYFNEYKVNYDDGKN